MVMMQQLSGGLGMTVLIYSQSRPLQQALQSSLNAMGCKAVVTISTANEAETILAVQNVEVALVTDVGMITTLRNISPDLPIVSLSSNASDVSARHLRKPFRIQELEQCLMASACENSGQQPSAMAL
jgi:quinolinate synthase